MPAADWFFGLHASSLHKRLSDPAKLSEAVAKVLPPDVARLLVAYSEMGLSGSVTINFGEGVVRSCQQQSHSHHRDAQPVGPRSA